MSKLFVIVSLSFLLSAFELSSEIPEDLASPNDRGMAYLKGIGVEIDYKEAMRLFRISAAEGNQYAQANIGLMYSDGLGVEQDYKMSAKWLKKSAIQGNASAQTSLGYLYDYGKGVKQDYTEAVSLYRLAANQGYAIAQRNLGFAYKDGNGVKKDPVYSLMWFFLAGTDEHEIAKGISLKEQEGLMKILGQEEIKKAVEMTTNCFKKSFIDC